MCVFFVCTKKLKNYLWETDVTWEEYVLRCPVQAIRFWWRLTLTFDLEKKLPIIWKLLVTYWRSFTSYCVVLGSISWIKLGCLTLTTTYSTKLFSYFSSIFSFVVRNGSMEVCAARHGLLIGTVCSNTWQTIFKYIFVYFILLYILDILYCNFLLHMLNAWHLAVVNV